MAVITEGVNGPVVGRLGNVVFYQVKGQNRARSLPRTPKRKRKPSPEQAMQRSKFKLVQQWLRPVKRLVRIGFGNFAPPKTGHNVAMSYNMRHAVIEHDDEFLMDPAAFRFSAGPLTPPVNAGVFLEDGLLHFTWDKPDVEARLGDSRTLLLAINVRNGYGYDKIYGAGVDLLADTLDLRFLNCRTGDTCHGYLAFVNVVTGEVSDTVYAGEITA